MIVCLCHGITDADIADARRRGLRHAKEVYELREVAPRCGSCPRFIARLLASEDGAGRHIGAVAP